MPASLAYSPASSEDRTFSGLSRPPKAREGKDVVMTDSKTFAQKGRVQGLTDTGRTRRPAAEGRLLSLRPDQLEPDPNQPRRIFPPEAIAALQRDIEANGQLQPILVRPADTPGTYFIILGECRWRAISQSSIVSTISAILRLEDADEDQLLMIQIAENTKRSDLSALELAIPLRA